VRAIAWLGSAAALQTVRPLAAAGRPRLRAYPFTLGVASGDPLPTGVVLWTRLAPEPAPGEGLPPYDIDVMWEVAADERFRTIVQRGSAVARPELGHSVHVDVEGLLPARDYYYRFACDGHASAVARTRTAPAFDAGPDRLRFAVCGCSHYEHGYFTAFRHIADEQFDFVFHTGDYIYEGPPRPGRPRQHASGELFTLDDYRNRYVQYKRDSDLVAAHHASPFVVTWDDHEVTNNYAGDHDERGTPPEVFRLRRAAAYQAYYEFMPIRLGTLPSRDGMRIYRRLRFGTLMDLHVLDTRQYRSAQACGDGAHTVCEEAASESRTLLGTAQEQWLEANLADSRSTWTVIGQQVPTVAIDGRGLSPSGAYSMDMWDGYTAARDRLYRTIVETSPSNPVVLSGDVHVHYASDLKLDYRDPRSRTIGAELTNTSISSEGDGADVQNGWDALQRDNPHIRFNSSRRGYIACTATHARLRADFRTIERVSVPGDPIRTSGSFVVETGRPGLVRDT
jgi:alkaline phosphatase D